MKFLLLTLITCLAACSTSNPGSSPRIGGISKQEAINIAKKEIVRRKITLPQDCTVEVVKDAVIVEFGPDIPIYVVSFNDPHRREPVPLYEVNVNRHTGEVQAFGDFHIIRR